MCVRNRMIVGNHDPRVKYEVVTTTSWRLERLNKSWNVDNTMMELVLQLYTRKKPLLRSAI